MKGCLSFDKSLSIILTLIFTSVYCTAKNPICDNYDKDAVAYENCFSFNDWEFIRIFKDEPKFSNGTLMDSTGEVFFEEYKRDVQNESRFTKDAIVYSIFPKKQYICNYEKFPAENLNDELNINVGYSAKFIVSYECDYKLNGEKDTSFAETEFQKRIKAEELIMQVLKQNFTELEEWKFYRNDGTLKFSGDMNGGYCMTANGMKKTKRVTSPKYCK